MYAWLVASVASKIPASKQQAAQGYLLTGIAPGGFESSGTAIPEGRALDRTQSLRIFQAIATLLGLSPGRVLKHSLVAGNVNLALVKQSLRHRSKKFSDSSPRKRTTLFFVNLRPGGKAGPDHRLPPPRGGPRSPQVQST